MAIVAISLLPVGLIQTWASVEHGYWYAKSPEFLQTDVIETFRWLRVIGDTVFAAGAIALAAFVIGLHTGGSTGIERFQARPASRYRAVSGLSDRDWCGLPRRASRGPVWCIDRAVHELTRRVNQP